MTPDTKHGASFGAASTTAELAEALRHIDKRITSPRENATLGAAADRLLKLERDLAAMMEVSNDDDETIARLHAGLEAGEIYAGTCREAMKRASAAMWNAINLLPLKGNEGKLARLTEAVQEIDALLAKNPIRADRDAHEGRAIEPDQSDAQLTRSFQEVAIHLATGQVYGPFATNEEANAWVDKVDPMGTWEFDTITPPDTVRTMEIPK